MNKPVVILCAGIIGTGLLILGTFAYYTLAYGRGNPEAGNFNRCRYWSEPDLETGKTIRNWERKWELTESAEGSFAYSIDCWVIGLGFVVVGAGIWVTHCSTPRDIDLPIDSGGGRFFGGRSLSPPPWQPLSKSFHGQKGTNDGAIQKGSERLA